MGIEKDIEKRNSAKKLIIRMNIAEESMRRKKEKREVQHKGAKERVF
jgi:hypothetical protein